MKKVARKTLRQLKEQGIGYEFVPQNDNVERLPVKTNLTLRTFKPLTNNQSLTFEAFDKDRNLLLHGLAGTGKTFISMYLALREVLDKTAAYRKVYIIRSVVPTRDMGFLPGNAKEKSRAYELPYYSISSELFGRGDAYDILKQRNVVEFMTTSFIRGTTLNNAIVIVDECQNMTFHELDSVITRVGHNCKVIFSGDFRQSDLSKSERSGINSFMRILDNMKRFEYIEFQEDDIVRSGIVKDYIITKDRLGITQAV